MKAALLREFGKPLEIAEIQTPEPNAGQVLIKIAACGACHSDVHVAHGEWEGFKARMPMPVVLGHEVAGTVVRLGPAFESFAKAIVLAFRGFITRAGTANTAAKTLRCFAMSRRSRVSR